MMRLVKLYGQQGYHRLIRFHPPLKGDQHIFHTSLIRKLFLVKHILCDLESLKFDIFTQMIPQSAILFGPNKILNA